jgi:putative ABC transport system substrate-binding protein
MRRREFITLIIGAAVGWPALARGERLPVIGYLSSGSLKPNALDAVRLTAFRKGLNEVGYVEGQNVIIEYRFSEGQHDRLTALAADLVHRQVAVISAVGGTPAAVAAKAATSTIPIVFAIGVDPVELGLVASLSRPGDNVTGVTSLTVAVMKKRVELVHELIPTAAFVALFVNPRSPVTATETSDAEQAAQTLGLKLLVLNVSSEDEMQSAFSSLAQQRSAALVISADTFFTYRYERIVALAAHYALPAIYSWREGPMAGGLMSYAGDLGDTYRLVGIYTGRVLKGEKPANLPVQQSTKVELVINMKTAKALGLTIPPTLLARADEMIE